MQPFNPLLELTLREMGSHWRVLRGSSTSSDLHFKRTIVLDVIEYTEREGGSGKTN